MLEKLRIKFIKLYSLRLFLTIFCLFSLQSAYAQTLNHTQMEGADIRILFDNEPMLDQSDWRYGLIDVKLQPNWKTYWKNSGNSGLSPDLQLDNGVEAELLFPTPHLSSEGKDWAYIYKEHAQIPFRIAAKEIKNMPLKGSLLIGICDTICVPVDVAISLDNHPSTDFVNKLKIQTALSALPSKPTKQFFVKSITQKDKTLEIALNAPNLDKNLELYLVSVKGQIGVAKLEKNEANEFIFSAPLLSGKLADGEKIEFIAKQGDKSINGTIELTKY